MGRFPCQIHAEPQTDFAYLFCEVISDQIVEINVSLDETGTKVVCADSMHLDTFSTAFPRLTGLKRGSRVMLACRAVVMEEK